MPCEGYCELLETNVRCREIPDDQRKYVVEAEENKKYGEWVGYGDRVKPVLAAQNRVQMGSSPEDRTKTLLPAQNRAKSVAPVPAVKKSPSFSSKVKTSSPVPPKVKKSSPVAIKAKSSPAENHVTRIPSYGDIVKAGLPQADTLDTAPPAPQNPYDPKSAPGDEGWEVIQDNDLDVSDDSDMEDENLYAQARNEPAAPEGMQQVPKKGLLARVLGW